MGYDAYKKSDDYLHEGSISIHPKLGKDVFEKKSKSRMRFGLAARALGQTMKQCILSNGCKVKKASWISQEVNTFSSYIKLCDETDRFIDVCNARDDRNCSLINSPNHVHVYELLDYVKFLTQWRGQARNGGNPNHYFAPSTHQDSCWTALSFVIIARKDLPEGHAIVQSRGGTDNIEKTFCKSRGDNRAATAQGTDGSIANNQGSFLMKIVKTRGNTGHVKEIDPREIDDMMVKKRRII